MPTLYILVFLTNLITFDSIACMLSEFQYKPYMCDKKDIPQRKLMANLSIRECAATFSNITIIKKANKREKKGVCYNYAIQKITGCVTAKHHNNVHFTLPLDPKKYFDQTKNPKKNDLVIYTDNKRVIRHFAVFIHKNLFESKWGTHNKIIQHTPFAVPYNYSNTITFWTLKKEYRTPEGKKLLLKNIRMDIDAQQPRVETSQQKDIQQDLTLPFINGCFFGYTLLIIALVLGYV